MVCLQDVATIMHKIHKQANAGKESVIASVDSKFCTVLALPYMLVVRGSMVQI